MHLVYAPAVNSESYLMRGGTTFHELPLGELRGMIKYHSNNYQMYENIANVSLTYGDPNSYRQFYTTAVNRFPRDPNILMDAAVLEAKIGDNAAAVKFIQLAADDGQAPQYIYDSIVNNRPFTVNVSIE